MSTTLAHHARSAPADLVGQTERIITARPEVAPPALATAPPVVSTETTVLTCVEKRFVLLSGHVRP
ncbi:hypothetical protein OG426_19485 [Streptomyces canus]|uniref:hypothetical protein n=1 Tax=Streptomyces canus TaxID=58343 RepID=UPI00386AC6CC|nr:hypothetical protein OG426_19485 [Streptomyces canus]